MKNNSMPEHIEDFVKYNKKPNAIKFGTLYTKEVKMEVPHEQKRTLRVYLPEDYNPKDRYPVIYMCDAQNIVDRHTSAYGEWDIDEHMHSLIKKGYHSFIVVGCDCPVKPFNRMREYTMNDAHFRATHMAPIKGYGKKYADYIINVIKPMIDKTFATLPEREYTAFGGSSMGGLCAFDIVSMYPKTFSFALSFSPAFFVMRQREYKKDVASRTFNPQESKYYFFSGGKDLDAKILPGTVAMYDYLRKNGFDDNHVGLIVDSEVGHCEASWSKYFQKAMEFWLIRKKED